MEELKKIIRAKLIEVINRTQPIITYSNLKKECKINIILPNLVKILDEINEEEKEINRPLMSIVVVKEKDKAPGSVFFKKAIDKGWFTKKKYTSYVDFYTRQIIALQECWIGSK